MREVGADGGLVERGDRDREMVDVAALAARRRAAHRAELAVDGDEIDQRTAGAQLIEPDLRSEEHTSELQSLMRITYAGFCLKKKKTPALIHMNKISSIIQKHNHNPKL